MNIQLPKPAYIYLLYILVRGYFLAKEQERYLYARSLLTPIVGIIFINLYIVFMLHRWTIWTLVLPITAVSVYYYKGKFDVRKGRLKPDKPGGASGKYILVDIIVLIISFIIVKLAGFDYFIEGF